MQDRPVCDNTLFTVPTLSLDEPDICSNRYYDALKGASPDIRRNHPNHAKTRTIRIKMTKRSRRANRKGRH
jgi:hypothetical protein